MSELSIKLEKVLNIDPSLQQKDLYLKLSSSKKSCITKTVKQGRQINWTEDCRFD